MPEALQTQHLQLEADFDSPTSRTAIAQAARLLQQNKLVAFPTETVYGLGANATNAQAIERIFTAKDRPHWDPLIVHVSDARMMARVTASVPKSAQALMEAFWPGPLTLLLPRASDLPLAVTANRPLVGVRMPRHDAALTLIAAAGIPIAAPSANRFGHTSPTTAQHVLADLATRIEAVLDAGPTEVGLESTVFDPATLTLYRPGAVTQAMLEQVLGATIALAAPTAAPDSPGTSPRHYAPTAPLQLAASEAELQHLTTLALASNPSVAVLLPDNWHCDPRATTFPFGNWQDPEALAHNLFAAIRALDAQNPSTIICPLPPGDGLPTALRDRLTRAARKS